MQTEDLVLGARAASLAPGQGPQWGEAVEGGALVSLLPPPVSCVAPQGDALSRRLFPCS